MRQLIEGINFAGLPQLQKIFTTRQERACCERFEVCCAPRRR